MTWRALVPFKDTEWGKSRLADTLTPEQRRCLSRSMLDHVLRTLGKVSEIEQIGLVSRRPATEPRLSWMQDRGRGLNVELGRARRVWNAYDILVIHADLPKLQFEDVRLLLRAADQFGAALAPDRHGSGTNAIAIKAGRAFQFQFGPDSFSKHASDVHTSACVLRSGLSTDIDSADDLKFLAWSD